MFKLINGDCLEVMQSLIDDDVKVDMILTDPPYGTMKGGAYMLEWDTIIEPSTIFEWANKLLRQNGKMLLFSQQPYTSQLILNTIPRIQFIQTLYWYKHTAGMILGANKNAVQYIEDMVLFRKDGNDYEKAHPLRDYFLKEKEKTGLSNQELNKILGSGMAGHYFTKGIQFVIPTKENYKKLQSTGYFKKPFEEIQQIDKDYKNKYPSTFNLWEGNKLKSNVFEYDKDKGNLHPTQKPVKLLEDLIKTYTNENDLVLDFTMGSGSTGVACMNTNRQFIGIELDKDYFNIAQERCKNYQTKLIEV